MKILTVIQSRTTSSRLSRKILLPLGDSNVLIKMLERVKIANFVDKIVIATTTDVEDEEIVSVCQLINVDYFRGQPIDCLDRHYQVAKKFNADVVVKIPSDCPLIDPAIIDRVIGAFIDNYPTYDYYSNLHPATYPDGNDVEIFKFSVLEQAWQNAKKDYEREHTTPYIWENQDKFIIGNVSCESKSDFFAKYRWTLDYIEDYQLISIIFNNLYNENQSFGIYDIIEFLDQNPNYKKINEIHLGKYWYSNHLNELKHIDEFKKLNNELQFNNNQ